MQKKGEFVQICEENCRCRLQFSIYIAEDRKMQNGSTVCSAKNVRFWEFLPEFVQFCEKTSMELQILTSIINLWVSQKHAFFIVYAWICAFLWEICKESCRCWLQYLIEVFEKKQKILTWSTIRSTKTCELLLEFVPICEKIVRKSAYFELQYSTYMFAKKRNLRS